MGRPVSCTCGVCDTCLCRRGQQKRRDSIKYRLAVREAKQQKTAILDRRQPTVEERAFEKLRRELGPWMQSGSAF